MRVGIVAGILVPNDAISAAACGQAQLISTLPGVESVTLFAQNILRDTPCAANQHGDAWRLALDPAFVACDWLIFHWGITYGLFDVLTLLGPDRLSRTAIHFHNCTPAALVHDDHRAVIEQSIAQFAHAISLNPHLWTYSEFNRRTLLEWGADERRISFVPFPIDAPVGLAAVRSTETVDLVSVGRFVPAKGQRTLVDAVGLLDPDVKRSVRVRLAGSATFSDPTYYRDLWERIRMLGLADSVTVVDDPSDAELWELYASSHVVVSTSLHEGLCVPIIEGYAVGCHAVGTTEGNLPYLVVPPDAIVDPSDPVALARAIEQTVARLGHDDPDYDGNRDALVHSFSTASCRVHLIDALFS